MKNRFIVLIDFSDQSEALLRFAGHWGRRLHADIALVHQTPVLLPAMTPAVSKKKITDLAHADAVREMKALARNALPPDVSVHYLVSEKPLVGVLNELLRKHYHHLVFLGVKQTGLLKKIFIGSDAVKIIDGIDSVIVAMPKNAPCVSPEAIHVAVQKKYPLNVFEFNKFLKWSGKDIKKVTFFSFLTSDDDPDATLKYLKELTALYSDQRDTAYRLYQGDDELTGLKNLIAAKEDEFVVVQRGARMLFDQIFRKFLVNELVYEGRTPLIILP
jgi:nucleotide-binding universal stress UspA family protein